MLYGGLDRFRGREPLMDSMLDSRQNKVRNGRLFTAFSSFYLMYAILFIFTAGTIGYGIQISGVDIGYLLSSGMFAICMAILYITAFAMLTFLYFIKTNAKKLAVAGVVLPIVALHIARAVITSYHPVTIYP